VNTERWLTLHFCGSCSRERRTHQWLDLSVKQSTNFLQGVQYRRIYWSRVTRLLEKKTYEERQLCVCGKNIFRRFRIIFDIQRTALVSCKEWRFITRTAIWSCWNGHHFSTFSIKTLAPHKEIAAACYKKQQGRSGNSCLI